jgi:hypothetical protein
MLEINHNINGNGYDIFNIKTEEGEFFISFQGNLDLYWSYFSPKSIDESPDSKIFTITKENYYFYNLLDNLYNAIKNNKPYLNGDNSLYKDHKEIDMNKYDKEHKLFKNKIIEWHSDEDEYDTSAVLKIFKENKDEYKIEFNKSHTNEFIETYSIRFRNSGSRYDPYNITFMNMYQELKKYNFEYHQIHIEEYLYQRKLIKKHTLKK